MIDNGVVVGGKEQAVPLIISKDSVYIHTEIEKIENEDLWRYKEIEYTKDEYIKLLADKNKALEKQIEDTEVALLQLYESMI